MEERRVTTPGWSCPEEPRLGGSGERHGVDDHRRVTGGCDPNLRGFDRGRATDHELSVDLRILSSDDD